MMRGLFVVAALLAGCTVDNSVIVEVELDDEDLMCVTADGTSLFSAAAASRPVMPGGICVVLDIIRYGDVTRCAPVALLEFCDDHDCQRLARHTLYLPIEPLTDRCGSPPSGPCVKDTLSEALAQSGDIRGPADAGVVVVRAVGTFQSCVELGAAADTPARFEPADAQTPLVPEAAFFCLTTCPADLGQQEIPLSLGLDLGVGQLCTDCVVQACANLETGAVPEICSDP